MVQPGALQPAMAAVLTIATAVVVQQQAYAAAVHAFEPDADWQHLVSEPRAAAIIDGWKGGPVVFVRAARLTVTLSCLPSLSLTM